MLEEQWVSLNKYPNYEISNYGRVINTKTGRELKPCLDKRAGHLRIALYSNGRRYDVQINRLVAECYFLNYKEGIEVNNINGNKLDNGVLNLSLGHNCRKAGKY